ncbi:MAG: Coenzyme F420 hydrogenase/dehydrogenase, beta subunit C-terminal domain, partial [Candidatus Omnitrophica bacterium]|nr:Coenzyme F420 hydrogenase/dehydrogenase, beta subunit C-terminal domain [Candidatus Omnitrophota bacterium]
MKLCEEQKCTGCAACYNVCPVSAIKMVEDKEGFLRPLIDKRICAKCGLCVNICPEINTPAVERFKTPPAYAAWNLDKPTRINSSSGGIFSIFADYILEQGGVVFGAAFDENLMVKHVPVFKKKDLPKLRGSKYVQSEISSSFKQIKEYLNENRKVLFSGTPCQVTALLSFLGKDYANLLTCDLICHGVSSPKVFNGYLRYIDSKKGAKIISASFRDKYLGWDSFAMKLIFENGKKYLAPYYNDKFLQGFFMDIYSRPSCGICQYAKIPRAGDITMGDFWGIGRKHKFEHDTFEGISLVLINSRKGEDVFNLCQDRYFKIKRELEEAVEYNLHLRLPAKPNKHRADFFLVFNNKGFGEGAKKYLVSRLSIKRMIAKIIGSKTVKFLKNYKRAGKFLSRIIFHSKAVIFNNIVAYWEEKAIELLYISSTEQDAFRRISSKNSKPRIILFEDKHLNKAVENEYKDYLKKNGYLSIKIAGDTFAFSSLHLCGVIKTAIRLYLRRLWYMRSLSRKVRVESNKKVFTEHKEAFGPENILSQQVGLTQGVDLGGIKSERVIITTAYNYCFKQVGDICASRIRQYCARHNIDYAIFETEKLTSRPSPWSKLLFINYILPKYLKSDDNGWVMWLDADAVIINNNFNLIEQVIKKAPAQTELIITRDKSSVNTGVMILRSSGFVQKLLKQWWSMEECITHGWWEQKALINLIDKNWENI